MPDIVQLGSRYRVVKVAAGTIPYDKGNTRSLELPNTLLSKKVVIRLTGNLIIGVANAANIFSEAPLGLIKKVELVGDGRDFLFSLSGRNLWRLAHFMNRKQGEASGPIATVGTRAFSATLTLDHEALNFADPSESLFDPRLYKKVELRITWGAETDIATAGGGGGTIAIDTPNTSVDVTSYLTAEGVSKIMFNHSLVQDEKPVVATTQFLTFDIPQGGLLAGIMFQVDRDAGAGAGPGGADDIINSVTIKSDTTVVHLDRVKWRPLQQDNVFEFQLDGGAAVGAQIPGYAYLDLSENGMFSSTLNINALNKAQLILDVTLGAGTQTVRPVYDFFQPRKNLQQEIEAAA